MAQERKQVNPEHNDDELETPETSIPAIESIEHDDVDDLLDEIDEVLEENAAEFVNAYVQKGGE